MDLHTVLAANAGQPGDPAVPPAVRDGGPARRLLDGEGLTEPGRRVRAAIEADTDTGQQRLIAAIGSDPDAVIGPLGTWSDRLVAAGAFPTSVHKRAAG